MIWLHRSAADFANTELGLLCHVVVVAQFNLPQRSSVVTMLASFRYATAFHISALDPSSGPDDILVAWPFQICLEHCTCKARASLWRVAIDLSQRTLHTADLSLTSRNCRPHALNCSPYRPLFILCSDFALLFPFGKHPLDVARSKGFALLARTAVRLEISRTQP